MSVVSKRTVLVVDDDEQTRYIMSLILTKIGFNVTVASDGESGIRVFESIRPHIVITDLHMPKMNGRDVIRHIQQHIHKTKIFLFTADINVVLPDGVGIIHKPFGLDELTDILRDV